MSERICQQFVKVPVPQGAEPDSCLPSNVGDRVRVQERACLFSSQSDYSDLSQTLCERHLSVAGGEVAWFGRYPWKPTLSTRDEDMLKSWAFSAIECMNELLASRKMYEQSKRIRRGELHLMTSAASHIHAFRLFFKKKLIKKYMFIYTGCCSELDIFVPNKICGFGGHFGDRDGGWRLQAVLDILEVIGRASGRTRCLQKKHVF